MYTKLKQLMAEHGYKPTEGGDWTGHDTSEFAVFAHFVLALPKKIAHRFLAYPQAFPEALERLAEIAGVGVDSLPTPESTGAPESIPTPAAAPIEPVAPPADTSVIDVSGDAPPAAAVAPVAEPVVEQPPVETPPVETPPTEQPADTSAPGPVVTESDDAGEANESTGTKGDETEQE